MNQVFSVRSRWVVLSYLVISLTALALRLLDLGSFANEDEVQYWFHRSDVFLRAIQSGDFAATAITTHPGVTTMWCGSVGILLRDTLFDTGLLKEETFSTILTLMRLPVALINSLGVLLGYALLRRMFPPLLAALAAFLWATDPFVVAFDRILHVDGLTGTFATLSILAAGVYWNHSPRLAWLVLSGACAALAILSKSPGVVVLPVVVLLALAAPGKPRLRPLVLWGAVGVLTVMLVWPAVWADPSRVFEVLRVGVEVEGSSPHVQGNFFLGREMDEPDLRFYPVVLVLRTTPLTLVGLLLLPFAMVFEGHGERGARGTGPGQGMGSRDVALLAGFVILFVLAMSFFPKKLNRYLVPVFPAVDILATAGLMGVMLRSCKAATSGQETTNRVIAHIVSRYWSLMVGGMALFALFNAAWYHPYGIAAFNQLLGGHRTGVQTFLVGAGEGLEQVARWLNQQPDITGVVTMSTMVRPLHPYLRPGAYARGSDEGTLPERTGYVVVYLRNVLTGPPSPPFDQFYGQAVPLHIVSIHGVDYAWIYQVPPPVAHSLPPSARFGDGEAIRLWGYEVDPSALRSSGVLTLTAQWQALAPIASDYTLFVHVFNDQGQRVGHIDTLPGGAPSPTHAWEPGRFLTRHYPIPVQAGMPAGTIWIALGLYRPDDGTRLPLHSPPPPGAPDDGANALFLEPIHLQ
ncbi:MAG: phospholipid carrier-dependent glycosyltransferase [Chloroflexaceae bacterium]|nr:phospholipid carrier-dependent glycosyltransferase [Chloroflexaceae bacterium]